MPVRSRGGGGDSGPAESTTTTDAGAGANGVYVITSDTLTLATGVLDGWKIDKNSLTASVTEVSASNHAVVSVDMGGSRKRMGFDSDAPNNNLLIYKEISDATNFDLKVRVFGDPSSAVFDSFFVGMWRKETDSGEADYTHKSPVVGVTLNTGNTTPLSDIRLCARFNQNSGTGLQALGMYTWSMATDTARWLRVKRTGGVFTYYTMEDSTDDPDSGTWHELDGSTTSSPSVPNWYGSGDASPHHYDLCGGKAVIGFAVGGPASVTVNFYVERIILTMTSPE